MNKKETKEYNEKYHKKHKKKANACSREYYHKNKEVEKEKRREFRRKNPEKMKDQDLRKNYGLSLDKYNKIFSIQKGCCVICGKHQSELNRALCVDHNHITNSIRGLLCPKCNVGIGMLCVDENETELLKQAIKYIKKYK